MLLLVMVLSFIILSLKQRSLQLLCAFQHDSDGNNSHDGDCTRERLFL